MTEEEALKFFPGQDDLEDAYENQLFEYKQFFLSKAPISKLFESRLRKLLKLGEAYDLLTGEVNAGSVEIKPSEVNSSHILETYLSFQKSKNEVKRLISNTSGAHELAKLAEGLVDIEKMHASNWHTEVGDEEEVIVSKEPDPMYLLDAIKIYQKQGGETFQQLKKLENNPPELLIQEMKRLSLLFKKY